MRKSRIGMANDPLGVPTPDPIPYSPPYGGFGAGYETLGALDNRDPGPGPTQYCEDVDYHTRRTLIPPDATPEPLREATVKDGVTFRERIRADLPDNDP
jgi:hypothetical protein